MLCPGDSGFLGTLSIASWVTTFPLTSLDLGLGCLSFGLDIHLLQSKRVLLLNLGFTRKQPSKWWATLQKPEEDWCLSGYMNSPQLAKEHPKSNLQRHTVFVSRRARKGWNPVLGRWKTRHVNSDTYSDSLVHSVEQEMEIIRGNTREGEKVGDKMKLYRTCH